MNDAEKIAQVEEIVQSQNSEKIFEVVNLALSIQDEEDRDLYLLDAIRWLVKNRIWQKAYGAAQLMSESYEKSQALQEVADYLASIGHLAKAFSIFAEAEKASTAGSLAEWQKAELLHNIAKSLRRTKAVFKADEVWEKAITAAQKGEESPSSQDSYDSSGVLAEIAEYFATEERIEEALSVAQKIKNIGKKEKVRRQISAYSQQIKQIA
jgi:tetratricopeptide (TPR) repeat protein